MFFQPKFYEKNGEKQLRLSNHTKLLNCSFAFRDFALNSLAKKDDCENALSQIRFSLDFPRSLQDKLPDNDEVYAIKTDEKEAVICARKEAGLLFGFVTLLQMNLKNELFPSFLYDYPLCPVRGYRVFLPGRNNIPTFRRVIDMLAYYKYNCLVLEIGGAMEYKKHPEINEHWIEFAKEIHGKNGRADEIQHHTYPWVKNSIHCDNGDGGFLTQEECRDLARYCRERGIDVVPECPSMCHCDFMCIAHPEIAERQDDKYPDTYCPNHPATYPLVFDILSEVIDVFEPTRLHIGHDEMYSLAVCPRCKGKDPVTLYVDDIKKIHDFLKERNIQTWMWGEKLLDGRNFDGSPIGGAESDHHINGGVCHVHALYPCRDKLPSDITFLHWYWPFDPEYDKIYHERHYKMVFGNLSALDLEHWKNRVQQGAKGGFCSNWGSFADEYMQRNNQYIDLIGNACAYWTPDFDDDTKEKYLFLSMQEAFSLKVANVKHPIFVEHTTTGHMDYVHFVDGVFITDEKYELGNYELTYEDGAVCLLPVKYGSNITSCTSENYLTRADFKEISYSTMPRRYGDKFYYTAVYENPRPGKMICGIRYLPLKGREDFRVILKSMDVGVLEDTHARAAVSSSMNFIVG